MTPSDFCQPLYQNKVVTWKPPQCLTTVNARCNHSSRTSSFVPWLRGNKTTGQAASFPSLVGGGTGTRGTTVYCACLCLNNAYCVARQRGKTQQFSWLRNITGSKGRLDRSIPWRSAKLFTTKQCYATTTHNMQNFKHKCN